MKTQIAEHKNYMNEYCKNNGLMSFEKSNPKATQEEVEKHYELSYLFQEFKKKYVKDSIIQSDKIEDYRKHQSDLRSFDASINKKYSK